LLPEGEGLEAAASQAVRPNCGFTAATPAVTAAPWMDCAPRRNGLGEDCGLRGRGAASCPAAFLPVCKHLQTGGEK
jgi:hypothetical protein